MNPFLPDNYQPPAESSGNYFRFEDGENRVRILTAPILGYELWIGGKPKRIPMDGSGWTKEEIQNADINKFTGKPRTPEHFWAMVIWNYKTSRIQIMQINKKKIQTDISALNNDEDWGNPLEYDIVITKTGEGKETKYNTIPKPKKAVLEEIQKSYLETPVHLEALFTGEDPFAKVEDEI